VCESGEDWRCWPEPIDIGGDVSHLGEKRKKERGKISQER